MHKNKFFSLIAVFSVLLLLLPGTAAAYESEALQFTQAQAKQTSITFGFRLTGGASLLMRNDFNDYLQGENDSNNDDSFYKVNSEFELMKMGMDIGGEILINFMPNLSIGFGAGYISAEKETTAQLMFWTVTEDQTYHPKFSAIPITLSIYYGIPVGSSIDVVLNAGLGYYIGIVSFDYSFIDDWGGGSYEYEHSWTANSNALGFHGGIDLEFGIARNLAFIVGAKGRYAKLTDLTADLDWETFDSYWGYDSGTEEDMTLWFGQYESSGREYPVLIFDDRKPTASYFSDVRKAEANLSGAVFQAGIKVFF